jgi:hypothetical protein
LGGVLLLTSGLYVGLHVTRTGDYDGLESLFVLGYVLSFWAAADEPIRPAWLFAAVACLVGAVMTKGIAGVLPLPGCGLFFLGDGKRLMAFLKDWRTWVCGLAAAGICVGYYLSRELYDPGYLQAVYVNEWGGRFLTESDGNIHGPLFYPFTLIYGFPAGVVLLPFAVIPLFGKDPRRRDLATLCLASFAALLLVINWSPSKLVWYATPAIPLLSVAVGIGISDGIGLVLARRRGSKGQSWVAMAPLCVIGATIVFGSLFPFPPRFSKHPADWIRNDMSIRGGAFLADLHDRRFASPVTVVDQERWAPQAGGKPHGGYNPVVDFYARLYRSDWRISELQENQLLPAPSLAISCSPVVLAWLKASLVSRSLDQRDGCELLRLTSSPDGGNVAEPRLREDR